MRLVADGTIAVLDDLIDQGLSRAVARHSDLSSYDPRIQTHFCPWIPVGGVVVDGGAFIGDHTVPYAKAVGPTGQVWAFEPNPPALNCLMYNVQAYPQVHVVTAALGECRKMVRLIPHHRNAGATATGIEDDNVGIPMVPLDLFSFSRLDFLKLDIEGYELQALRGAEVTIAKHHPVIILESGVQLITYGARPEDLAAFLRPLGYDGGTQLPIQHGPDVYDVLFKPTVTM